MRVAMTGQNRERTQIAIMVFVALLFMWKAYDAAGPAPRYLSLAAVLVFSMSAAWKLQRYRRKFRAVR